MSLKRAPTTLLSSVPKKTASEDPDELQKESQSSIDDDDEIVATQVAKNYQEYETEIEEGKSSPIPSSQQSAENKIYVVYDAGCTVVRGLSRTLAGVAKLIETLAKNEVSREDLFLYHIEEDTPVEVGYNELHMVDLPPLP